MVFWGFVKYNKQNGAEEQVRAPSLPVPSSVTSSGSGSSHFKSLRLFEERLQSSLSAPLGWVKDQMVITKPSVNVGPYCPHA